MLFSLSNPGTLIAADWTDGTEGDIYYNGGNVGIGDQTPEQPLTVYDQLLLRSNNPRLTIRDDSTPDDEWIIRNQNSDFKLYTAISTSTNPAVTVQKSGNVGIVRSEPKAKLHIHGTPSDDIT